MVEIGDGEGEGWEDLDARSVFAFTRIGGEGSPFEERDRLKRLLFCSRV